MKRVALLLLAALLTSCASPNVHWTERAARDRIMLVRDRPETLGHKRLVYQASSHPDLADFLRKRGEPDFIAETSSDNRQYMILYYLDSRKAFACRSWRDRADDIEFAGPYKMTERETGILRELQERSVHTADTGIASGRIIVP